jgi:uncharacterized glyoxalase superfamily protein PhnB
MKLREGDPWMPADEYGRSLRGLTINLLVSDMQAALKFQREVLESEVVYSDPDFAVITRAGIEWMLHADHTYDKHPLGRTIEHQQARGTGIELRVHGCDPDAAEQAAIEGGYAVLSPATDKGHGVREAFVVDSDGYVWVPDVPLPVEE